MILAFGRKMQSFAFGSLPLSDFLAEPDADILIPLPLPSFFDESSVSPIDWSDIVRSREFPPLRQIFGLKWRVAWTSD